MAKARPSRPRPLTLRSLTAPAHAHKKWASRWILSMRLARVFGIEKPHG
ncbi:hypothetical protein HMPREF0539_2969 [Lacticaseibacillus rhamnosus LMS2-1]|uniref:Uncharacterized protein n=1 Tax=Lacticaseibacillus rhamnosus (strain LMS2-1) TaxID=525361 RepID=C2K1D4_LACRM|nr:conserved hypothetical protein [Lacticaseibacillus rhamnosus ATCC 8530]EEN78907.1 hypothetical protein HMPREF0539_2969 [Lacticaseibacillus rhamnosus LMS2-1]